MIEQVFTKCFVITKHDKTVKKDVELQGWKKYLWKLRRQRVRVWKTVSQVDPFNYSYAQVWIKRSSSKCFHYDRTKCSLIYLQLILSEIFTSPIEATMERIAANFGDSVLKNRNSTCILFANL